MNLEDNPQGVCKVGYEGLLCQDCSYRYFKSNAFSCTKCPDPIVNYITLSVVLIIVTIFIIFTIR